MSCLSALRAGPTSASNRASATAVPRNARGRAVADAVEDELRSSRDGDADAPSVLVVFADQTSCPCLRPLRRGFRHCFAVLRTGSLWLACEPLKDRIELDALALPPDFDLAAFYGGQGHRVLLGRRPPAPDRRGIAPAPLTCVTVVKRVLGIRAPWVWTPWQLYAHLSAPALGFRAWSGPSGPAGAGDGGPTGQLVLDSRLT